MQRAYKELKIISQQRQLESNIPKKVTNFSERFKKKVFSKPHVNSNDIFVVTT